MLLQARWTSQLTISRACAVRDTKPRGKKTYPDIAMPQSDSVGNHKVNDELLKKLNNYKDVVALTGESFRKFNLYNTRRESEGPQYYDLIEEVGDLIQVPGSTQRDGRENSRDGAICLCTSAWIFR